MFCLWFFTGLPKKYHWFGQTCILWERTYLFIIFPQVFLKELFRWYNSHRNAHCHTTKLKTSWLCCGNVKTQSSGRRQVLLIAEISLQPLFRHSLASFFNHSYLLNISIAYFSYLLSPYSGFLTLSSVLMGRRYWKAFIFWDLFTIYHSYILYQADFFPLHFAKFSRLKSTSFEGVPKGSRQDKLGS